MSLFALAGLAVDIAARPHTLRTWPDGSYVEGQWTQGEAVETPIRAVMQAPSARDLESLPEGERVEGLVMVWSRTPLNTADEDDARRADEIINAAGEAYRIVSARLRAEAGFYRALARLVTHDRGRSVPEPVALPETD